MTLLAHRNQKSFRKLLEAISYPGKLVEFSADLAYRGDLSNELMEAVISLVDGEVGLYTSSDDEKAKEEIYIRTNASVKEISQADFIVVAKEDFSKLSSIINQAGKGTYVSPDKGATIIVEIGEFSSKEKLSLRGPGIEGVKQCQIPNSSSWLQARNEAVEKFPMGIDMFFISADKKILGLPRTTIVKEEDE